MAPDAHRQPVTVADWVAAQLEQAPPITPGQAAALSGLLATTRTTA